MPDTTPLEDAQAAYTEALAKAVDAREQAVADAEQAALHAIDVANDARLAELAHIERAEREAKDEAARVFSEARRAAYLVLEQATITAGQAGGK